MAAVEQPPDGRTGLALKMVRPNTRVVDRPPVHASGVSTRRAWQRIYVRRLIVTDSLVVMLAVTLAHVVRFGQGDLLVNAVVAEWNYVVISICLAAMWIAFLAAFRTRSRRVIGSGYDEYQRIVSATFRMFGLVAIIALVFRLEIARGYLAIAFPPAGLLGLLLGRWVWRKVVAAERRRGGQFQTSVLVVGGGLARCD